MEEDKPYTVRDRNSAVRQSVSSVAGSRNILEYLLMSSEVPTLSAPTISQSDANLVIDADEFDGTKSASTHDAHAKQPVAGMKTDKTLKWMSGLKLRADLAIAADEM